jgi:hypothetical protein
VKSATSSIKWQDALLIGSFAIVTITAAKVFISGWGNGNGHGRNNGRMRNGHGGQRPMLSPQQMIRMGMIPPGAMPVNPNGDDDGGYGPPHGPPGNPYHYRPQQQQQQPLQQQQQQQRSPPQEAYIPAGSPNTIGRPILTPVGSYEDEGGEEGPMMADNIYSRPKNIRMANPYS